MALIGYEVGDNFIMTGDGNIGEDKLISETVCIVQRKATIKKKHFTVIGITNLLGEPFFFIVIIEGKDFFLFLGLYLIYLRRKLEIGAMENNTFLLM